MAQKPRTGVLPMNRIAVIGAGLMGSGIAQLLAAKGKTVSLFEPFEDARHKAKQTLRDICQSVGEPTSIADAIALTDNLAQAVEGVDVVIEAAPEKPQLKQQVFQQLVELCPANTLLGTNSSVIPVTTIAQQLSDSDARRVLGMHFWNPPYLVPLVEVIEGQRTSSAAVKQAMALMADIGQKPVHIRKDVVVGNRLQHALWREAIAMVAEGVVDGPAIDEIVKNSFGLRLQVLGPMENIDLIGLALTQDIHNVVFPQLSNDPSAHPLLQEMLDQGKNGMASGSGFHSWTPEQAKAKRQTLVDHLLKLTRPK